MANDNPHSDNPIAQASESARKAAASTMDALAAASHLFDAKTAARETRELAGHIVDILRGTSDIEIAPKDRRFKDPAWRENPFYRRLGQTYFAFCDAVEHSIAADGEWKEHERAEIVADIITSSLSPTNTLLGNPAALKRAMETRGGSLLDGLQNFWTDLRENGGMPRHVDKNAFVVGKDLGLTPGAVVFRNEVLEILQYKPQTKQVYKRPLLVMSPQINKFYFMDLAPGRSFVEYAVQNGIQTFVVAWRNPGPEHGHWNLDTYVEALLEATAAVCAITGCKDLNTMGFCAGGITMSAMLAHLENIGDARVHAIGYAVTLLDFSVPAMIGALNTQSMLDSSKRGSKREGVLRGNSLRTLFAWFRPNDLIWTFWVNNYLMGNAPPKFDILAWNNDPTNLPAGLHADFMDMFSTNPLPTPNAMSVLGSPVDLGKLKMDAFVTGALTDHLTPWKACYQTTQLIGGKSTFLLSNAGHVASLVNPPGNPKASYYTNTQAPPPNPEDWYANAEQHTGSWWEYWLDWIKPRSGEQKNTPRKLGNKKYPALDPAPGTYVFESPAGGTA